MSPNSPGSDFQLSGVINEIHPLPASAIRIIETALFPVTIMKNRFLTKPGTSQDCYYLIRQGVLRAYVKEEGKELTTWIKEENEFIWPISGFNRENVSREYVQALEDTLCIAIPVSVVEQLYLEYPEMNIVVRKILEHIYRDSEERAFISRIPSAEKRYKRFMETRPELAGRISLKYIASYLSMTLETLSRVRGRRVQNAAIREAIALS